MARKEALTEMQKVDVCRHYSDGMSFKRLGKEYNVSGMTISRVIKNKSDFVSLCDEKKKEAEERALKTMDEWVSAKLVEATTLCEKIMLALSNKDLSEESIRDLAGLLKIIREEFVPKSANAEKENSTQEKIEFVETDHADRDK